MSICTTAYCKNLTKNSNKYCSTCRSRKSRSSNPIRYAYTTLKNNAKRRGKPFNISYEYFKNFANEVEYLSKKGTGASSYHIDRKEEHLGYVEGNLQLLTNTANVHKYVKWCGRDQLGNNHFTTVTAGLNSEQDLEDLPF